MHVSRNGKDRKTMHLNGGFCSRVLTEEKDNRLVECHECHSRYHQKCHKPPVSTADISDPRSLWYCAKCRRSITKRVS